MVEGGLEILILACNLIDGLIMTKSSFIITALALAILTPCLLSFSDDCPQNINLLPMYGQVKKCTVQLKADSAFLKECEENFIDRREASKYYVGKGWSYFNKKMPDSAMMRFNQAWLLDSLNADVYWGFGNLTGMKKKYAASLPLFNRSVQLDPTNARVWEGMAASQLSLYEQGGSSASLHNGIQSLKKSVKLDPENPRVYAQLTTAYCLARQKDSAAKYLILTDRLDKNAISPNVRKLLSGHTGIK